MENLIVSVVSRRRDLHTDSSAQRSAKDGSIEALMTLSFQSGNNQRAHRAFFRVLEENLKFDTPSIQAMKRGVFH